MHQKEIQRSPTIIMRRKSLRNSLISLPPLMVVASRKRNLSLTIAVLTSKKTRRRRMVAST